MSAGQITEAILPSGQTDQAGGLAVNVAPSSGAVQQRVNMPETGCCLLRAWTRLSARTCAPPHHSRMSKRFDRRIYARLRLVYMPLHNHSANTHFLRLRPWHFLINNVAPYAYAAPLCFHLAASKLRPTLCC